MAHRLLGKLGTVVKVAVVFAILGIVGYCVLRYNQRADQDGAAWLDDATAEARAWAPDAELVDLVGQGVAPDGSTPVLDSFQVTWHYLFRSPTRVADANRPPPAVAPGAPVPPRPRGCYDFSVSLSKTSRGRVSAGGAQTMCPAGELIGGQPRCSIVDVWRRAIARGAPNAGYATIHLRAANGARSWHFEITDRRTNAAMFAADLPDDC